MRIKKMLLLLAGLLVGGEIGVQILNRARDLAHDDIEERGTIVSTVLRYERVSLCREYWWFEATRFECATPIAFRAHAHQNKDRNDTFKWNFIEGEGRWRSIADEKVAIEINRPVARMVAAVGPPLELSVGVGLLCLFLFVTIGCQKILKFADAALSMPGITWMTFGALVICATAAISFGNKRREVVADGVVESRTLTSTVLGYERVRLCTQVVGGSDWFCNTPTVFPLYLSREDALVRIWHWKMIRQVRLEAGYDRYARNYLADAAIWTTTVDEVVIGFLCLFLGFQKANLFELLVSRLKRVNWHYHAFRFRMFVTDLRTVAVFITVIGCLFSLAIAATVIENHVNRKSFDGFAERRTVTSWILGYDRVAPCRLAQYHGGGKKGYVCDRAVVFPRREYRWSFFEGDHHDYARDDRCRFVCALRPTANLPDQGSGTAFIAARIHGAYEIFAAMYILAFGIYLLIMASRYKK